MNYLLEEAALVADRWILRYETFNEQHELNLKNAELKCMMETGDIKELGNYFEATNIQEGEQKKENILKKMWRAIKELWKKIKDTIFKRKPKINPNQKYKVNKSTKKFIDEVPSKWQKVKGLLLRANNKLWSSTAWKIFVGLFVTASAGFFIAVAATNVPEMVKKKKEKKEHDESYKKYIENEERYETIEAKATELLKAYNTLNDITDTITKVCEKGEKDPSSVDPENAKEIKKLQSNIQKIGGEFAKALNLNNTSDKMLKKYAEKIKKHAGDELIFYDRGPGVIKKLINETNIESLTDEQVLALGKNLVKKYGDNIDKDFLKSINTGNIDAIRNTLKYDNKIKQIFGRDDHHIHNKSD